LPETSIIRYENYYSSRRLKLAIRAYNSPGVTVTETVNPALAPLIANPSLVCLVGPAAGEQSATERVFLSGTDPVQLRYSGVDGNSVVVTDNVTGNVINTGNYVLVQGTDPDISVTGDEPWTIARIPGPEGSANTPVAVSGTGTLNGTFVYAYSYVNTTGESGLSPNSNTIVLAAQGTDLSNISVGPTGTTARNIYRAPVVNGLIGQFTLVGTLNNNTATTLTGETASVTTTLPKVGIANNQTVIVTYSFTDQFYFEPTLFSDYDDITTKYGPAFDSDGNISSALSFAARIAFQNGASEIVLLASTSNADTDIALALSKLESDESIQMIGVVSGGTSVHAALSAHLTAMGSQGRFRMGVVGRDTVASPLTAQQLRDSQVYNNEALIMVSPGSFKTINPVSGREVLIGGQYAAAGVIGMFAARDVHIPLTRKTVAGFTGVADKRSVTEMALDSAAGLMVIEEKNGVLRVRHGLTTAIGNVNTREASVVRAKYDMALRLRDTLDGIVGVVAPVQDAPGIVSSLVTGVLSQLVSEQTISGFQNVKARLLASDLTTVEVKYEYTPAYPINNISVIFTINTQTGDVTDINGLTNNASTGGTA
jgi:hypothetical protein